MGERSGDRRYIVVPDTHFEKHDIPAWKCVLKAIKMVKPYGLIHLGDCGEWESVSHWKYKKKKRPPLEYQLVEIDKDLADVNSCMDELDKVCKEAGVKEKHYIQGNHDLWLDYFVEENPYLKDYKFEKAVKIKERGYRYWPVGKYLKLGHLWVYHGHLNGAGDNHAKAHLVRMGVSVLYGHFHDHKVWYLQHADGPKMACCLGTLKSIKLLSLQLSPSYQRWNSPLFCKDNPRYPVYLSITLLMNFITLLCK